MTLIKKDIIKTIGKKNVDFYYVVSKLLKKYFTSQLAIAFGSLIDLGIIISSDGENYLINPVFEGIMEIAENDNNQPHTV